MPEKQADDTRLLPVFLLKYVIPALLLVSTQWWSEYLGANTLIIAMTWVAGLTIMGLACLANARRCGRVHCHFTGPYMLVFAIAFLIYGSEIYQPAWVDMSTLGNAALWGTGLLWIVSELFFGKYFGVAKNAG